MANKPVTIDGHEFKSQKAAAEFAKEILRRTWACRDKHRSFVASKNFVAVKNKADHRWLKALFKHHPEARNKYIKTKSSWEGWGIVEEGKTGVAGFSVGIHRVHGNVCFWLRCSDGTSSVPWSYAKAIRQAATKQASEATSKIDRLNNPKAAKAHYKNSKPSKS